MMLHVRKSQHACSSNVGSAIDQHTTWQGSVTPTERESDLTELWLNRDRSCVLSADTVRPRQSPPETNHLKKVGRLVRPCVVGRWMEHCKNDDNHLHVLKLLKRYCIAVYVFIIQILQHLMLIFRRTDLWTLRKLNSRGQHQRGKFDQLINRRQIVYTITITDKSEYLVATKTGDKRETQSGASAIHLGLLLSYRTQVAFYFCFSLADNRQITHACIYSQSNSVPRIPNQRKVLF